MNKKNKRAQSSKPNVKVRDTTPHKDVKAGSGLVGLGVGSAQGLGGEASVESQKKEGGLI